MDKTKDVTDTFNHAIQLSERKNIIVTGVKKLDNYDENEFFAESIMGHILIKGEGLELLKLDTFQGTLSIKGKINSIAYLDENNKKMKADNIIARLFK